MGNRRFNAVFFLIVEICAFLDPVSLEDPGYIPPTPPPPGSPWVMYYKQTPNGDFGIRMEFESSTDNTMTVTISYDTDTDSASTFFKNKKLPGWLDGFSACNVITWEFNPCTVSKLQGGQLVCASTVQCDNDPVHSCIATAFNSHPDLMAKFLICVFSGKTAIECGKAGGLIEDDINECVKSGRGAQSCDHFHTIFEDAKKYKGIGEMPNAITDFKIATCTLLGQAGLQCQPFCSQP